MWFPDSEIEVLKACNDGTLTEGLLLEVKREVPKHLANTVCAFANTQGGLILIGVEESLAGFSPSPNRLEGLRERVDNTIRSSISPPVYTDIRAVRSDGDPDKGYILVIVPQSTRMPHMVTTGREHRYYGRSSTGNHPLPEAEVARLYQLQRAGEDELNTLLEELMQRLPMGLATRDPAPVALIARPRLRVHEAFPLGSTSTELQRFIQSVPSRVGWFADVGGSNPWTRIVDEWVCTNPPRTLHGGEPGPPGSSILLSLTSTGVISYYNGDIGDSIVGRNRDNEEVEIPLVNDHRLADLVHDFLLAAGETYQHVDLIGDVHIGLLVRGLKGRRSVLSSSEYKDSPQVRDKVFPFPADSYLRAVSTPTLALVNTPTQLTRELVGPLLDSLVQDGYPEESDPLKLD